MVSEPIGRFFSWLRDQVARGLLRAGVRPNHVTVFGTLVTVAAGVAIAAGRAWWPLAAGLIVAAGGADMLDGAMANLRGLKSRFGSILDSICDRASDTALFMGPAVYFVLQPDSPAAKPNLTLLVLASLGLLWAYLTSYTRARAAEELPGSCTGGFWQRGERVVTILLGAAFGHVATAVWILGLWPAATVAHRLWWVGRACRLADSGVDPASPRPEGAAPGQVPAAQPIEPTGLLGLVLWRHKRGSLAFDIHAGIVILACILWAVPEVDPLRDWLGLS